MASALSVVLDFVTYLLLMAMAGVGAWGNSAAFEAPRKYLVVGLVATAILTFAKTLHLASRRGP